MGRLSECTRCGLRQGCERVTMPRGAYPARLLVVGDAPSAEEEAEGLALVGDARRMLEKLLRSAGIEVAYYATSAVKCRTPSRRPRVEERRECGRWLVAEVERVRPRLILALGDLASRQCVLQPLSRASCQLFDAQWKPHGWPIPTLVIPHPSKLQRGRKAAIEEVVRALRKYARPILAPDGVAGSSAEADQGGLEDVARLDATGTGREEQRTP